MSHSPEPCDCIHCRLGRSLASAVSAVTEYDAANSRMRLVGLRVLEDASLTVDRKVELTELLKIAATRGVSRAAVLINAACDQVEAEVSR